jgi:hypothetical protein
LFRIDAFSVDSIPMKRLAEYMSQLASLVGEQEQVHFAGLKRGSVGLAYRVDPAAEPRVRHRLRLVSTGKAPADALQAQCQLRRMLLQDHAEAHLFDSKNTALLVFPAQEPAMELEVGPLNQQGFVDGVPIRVGGENDPVPVHLEEPGQQIHICHASRALAREIAPHLFTSVLRVGGTGRWRRDVDGQWVRDRFTISGFEVLREVSLEATVAQLRELHKGQGSAAAAIVDLQKIRTGRTAKG